MPPRPPSYHSSSELVHEPLLPLLPTNRTPLSAQHSPPAHQHAPAALQIGTMRRWGTSQAQRGAQGAALRRPLAVRVHAAASTAQATKASGIPTWPWFG